MLLLIFLVGRSGKKILMRRPSDAITPSLAPPEHCGNISACTSILATVEVNTGGAAKAALSRGFRPRRSVSQVTHRPACTGKTARDSIEAWQSSPPFRFRVPCPASPS